MTVRTANRENQLPWLIALILALGTIACYWPVWHFDYVNLDDPSYVYDAPMVKKGLTWPGFFWAFHSVVNGNWNPLVWLSHMADTEVFGPKAGGHHLTNLALHVANVLLLFFVFKKMTGAVWRSAFLAAIFAWHPMHVESVAWISERKDVLSTLFWLLTMLAYVRYAQGFRVKGSRYKMWYGLALPFFALGLMCKSMLVTLPFVLLLMDYWPLERITTQSRISGFEFWKIAILEKTPFFALSIAACGVAVWTQKTAGAIATISFPARFENAIVSCIAYVEKFFWPVELSFFYPHPLYIPMGRVVFGILALAVISGIALWQFQRRKYLAVGWFWFLGTLVPVIGLVQIGIQAMADRYTYVPYIGFAIMLGWILGDLATALPRIQLLFVGIAAAGLACLASATRKEVGYWRDGSTLYEHATKINPANFMARLKHGEVLLGEGNLDDAAREFQEVIRLDSDLDLPYLDWGIVCGKQKKLDEAIPLFKKAIAINPNLAPAHFNLGGAYLLKNKAPEAIAEMELALQLNPEDEEGQDKLAHVLLERGQTAEALPHCQAFVKLEPTNAQAYLVLGYALAGAHRERDAMANFKEAIRLSPDSPGPINSLAWIYATSINADLRDGAEAVRLAERAATLSNRQTAQILDTLAAAYAEAGRFEDAIKTNEEMRKLAEKSQNSAMEDIARQRLQLYQAGKPYRDTQ